MNDETPKISPGKLAEYAVEFPYAKTQDGEVIFVENANEGQKYICWGCDRSLFRRTSKNGVLHFYHKDGTTISYETELHDVFKRVLHKRIIDGLNNNRDTSKDKIKIPIQWTCEKCQQSRKLDLLEIVADAKLEIYVGPFKPDISLYREDNSAFAVIEVEYKHPLEDNARKYYEENKIGVIEFILEDEKDLARIFVDPLRPNFCNMCQHPAYEVMNSEIINQPGEGQGNGNWGWFIGLLALVVIGLLAFLKKGMSKSKRTYPPKSKYKKRR